MSDKLLIALLDYINAVQMTIASVKENGAGADLSQLHYATSQLSNAIQREPEEQ